MSSMMFSLHLNARFSGLITTVWGRKNVIIIFSVIGCLLVCWFCSEGFPLALGVSFDCGTPWTFNIAFDMNKTAHLCSR